MRAKTAIFGYGNYGEFIAKSLNDGGYEVVIVDNVHKNIKKAKLDGFEKVYYIDIESDEEITDLIFDHNIAHIFCAMDDEEINSYLTVTVKSLFSRIKVVAICESKEGERKLHLAGADEVIDTMEATANRLFLMTEKPAVAKAIEAIVYKDRNLTFKEITIPKGSFLDGVNLKDIPLQKEYGIIVIGIVDKELGERFIFVTRGISHKLDAEDILVVIGHKDDIARFEADLKGSG